MTSRLLLFRRLALAGVLLALVVVVLGAWVRLSAAGLGCPDWPGCYGHLSVDSAAENVDAINQRFRTGRSSITRPSRRWCIDTSRPAWGLLILVLAGSPSRNRRDPQQPVALPIALVGLVIFQGLLGMWTVTLLLKPLIVVLHLIGGLATCRCWLAGDAAEPAPDARAPAPAGACALAARRAGRAALQIVLGGWTSSNYAALACPDFPTCQNSYWPHMDVKDAFVLWRGLGIDYEGGVLDHPARVAIHFVHRLGAIAAALMLGCVELAGVAPRPDAARAHAGSRCSAWCSCAAHPRPGHGHAGAAAGAGDRA